MASERLTELMSEVYRANLKINLSKSFESITNQDEYDLFCECILNYILDDYKRAFDLIYIKEDVKKKAVREMYLFQFLLNLYFLEFNYMYKIPITFDWLYEIDDLFLKKYHSHVENHSQKVYTYLEKRKKVEDLSAFFDNLTYRFVKTCYLLAPISTPTINLFSILDFQDRNAEFNRLTNTTLDPKKSFTEIEHQLERDGERVQELMVADDKNCMRPFIVSGCLKQLQVTQMFVAVGTRSTSTNVVIDHVIRRSYLNGLENVGDIIVEAEMTNKALIYKKKFVGVSGYMSRETDILCLATRVDYSVQDCGTKHFVLFDVKSKEYLDMIISRKMILDNGKLKTITAKDTNLIGKTIKLRSFVCCALDRNRVCKNCFGNPLDFKKDISVGGTTSVEVANRVSNGSMSIKHSDKTKTKEFDNEDLLKLFELEDSKLILKNLDNAQNIYLVFDKQYIEDIRSRVDSDSDDYDDYDDEEVDEMNDDLDKDSPSVSTTKMLSSLKIVYKNEYDIDNGEENEIDVSLTDNFLVLTDEMVAVKNLKLIKSQVDSSEATLRLSDIKQGTPMFNIKYVTKETSRFLKQMKGIIERPIPSWSSYDYNMAINDLASLIVDAGYADNVELINVEPLIYNLLKDPNDLTKRPDFRKEKVDSVVTNLSSGIFTGDLYSVLMYQELISQFCSLQIFQKKGAGVHDPQFRSSKHRDFNYVKRHLRAVGAI